MLNIRGRRFTYADLIEIAALAARGCSASLPDQPIKVPPNSAVKSSAVARRAKHYSKKSRLSSCLCWMRACLSTSPDLEAPKDKGRARVGVCNTSKSGISDLHHLAEITREMSQICRRNISEKYLFSGGCKLDLTDPDRHFEKTTRIFAKGCMQLPSAGFSIRKEFLYGFLEARPFQRRRCRIVADGYFDPEVTINPALWTRYVTRPEALRELRL
jgi:hypothetical protein